MRYWGALSYITCFLGFIEMPQGAAILYGCLMGYGGQLIASHDLGSPLVENGDRLSGAVESIVDFVERTYPTSLSEPFEALDHGPVRVLVDKGTFCMLILIIEGHEDEALREGMRQILEGFEERNEADLAAGVFGSRVRSDGRNALAAASNLMKVF
jgi:hypothetical protein